MGSLLQRPCASCSRADGPRLWAWHLNSYNLFSLFLHHHYERVAASVCFSPVIALTQRIRIRRHHLPGRPQAGSYAERLPRLVGARLRATGRLCITQLATATALRSQCKFVGTPEHPRAAARQGNPPLRHSTQNDTKKRLAERAQWPRRGSRLQSSQSARIWSREKPWGTGAFTVATGMP
jgi:hypothetical protein